MRWQLTSWPGLPQLVPGTKAGPGGPAGFATLKTLLITPELKAAGINVFGRPSGKASIVLKVKVRSCCAEVPPQKWHAVPPDITSLASSRRSMSSKHSSRVHAGKKS